VAPAIDSAAAIAHGRQPDTVALTTRSIMTFPPVIVA
jgi:hypothetical protein